MVCSGSMDSHVQKKLEQFFSNYRLLKFKKGEIIVRPDDPIFGIYLLKKGYIRQYVVSEDGGEITINIFRPISFIPMMLAISETENEHDFSVNEHSFSLNRYYFETASEVEVWRAPTDKTIDFVRNEPEVLFDLAKRFAAGLNGLSQRLEDLMFENAYKRVVSLLLYLSKRFGENQGNDLLINLPLTHKDISALVNLTRETTSRQLEKLTKRGVISYTHQYITINDLNKLGAET